MEQIHRQPYYAGDSEILSRNLNPLTRQYLP